MSTVEILAILFSWAVHYSDYPRLPVPPVQLVTHQWIVDNACYGKECKAEGWYNDEGIIYIDEKYANDFEGNFVSGLIVHEFTHYLQDKSGDWGDMTCEKRIAREVEAYFVQNQYIQDNIATVSKIIPAPTSCKP